MSDDTEPRPEPARMSRRRVVVVAAVATLAVVLGGMGALWATDVVDLGGGQDTALAQRAERATPPSTRPTGSGTPAATCRAPLTPEEPLRLWIAGDSLAGSLGPSLGERAAATGVVQPVYDSRVSSGLSTPGFFDWPKHATAEVRRLDPEIVVFIIGANDWRVPGSDDVDESGEPAWRSEYAQHVEEMLTVLEGVTHEGVARRIYWIGSPPMEDAKKDAGARQVSDMARATVAGRPDATYVDAYDLFSGEDGHYTETLPGPDGKPVLVRADDGIHFTPEGGDMLAEHVFEPLDDRCDLGAQTVPGAAKQVVRTKGSTEVAGTNRTSAATPTTAGAAPPPAPAATTPTAPASTPKTSPSQPPATTPTTVTPTTSAPDTTVPTTDPSTTLST